MNQINTHITLVSKTVSLVPHYTLLQWCKHFLGYQDLKIGTRIIASHNTRGCTVMSHAVMGLAAMFVRPQIIGDNTIYLLTALHHSDN